MDGPQAETGSITDDWLRSIHDEIASHPSILRPSAGKPECCIFRVPRTLREINNKAYSPRFVSIGPYHIRDPKLAMIQQHKYRYLGAVLDRHKQSPLSLLSLESLAGSLKPIIGKAIDCYSESISLSDDDFLKMLVVDSVFLIELFMRSAKKVEGYQDDPIFTMTCVLLAFRSDFLCLENQIPYFILEKIYNEVTSTDDRSVSSLASLALEFFARGLNLPRKGKVTAASGDLSPLHLLHLVREAFLPDKEEPLRVPTGRMIPCVSKLLRAGIHLCPPKDKDKTVLPDEESPGRMIQCVSKLRRLGIHLCPPKDKDKTVLPDEESPGRMIQCVSKLRRLGIHLCPPKDKDKTVLPDEESPGRMIQCVSKLRRVGIHLRPPKDKDKTFLAVHFIAEKGLLEMPVIELTDDMTTFLKNCIAYEQCYSKEIYHFTTYMFLLDRLVNTVSDVSYMCDQGIVDNWLGGDGKVARLINDMNKNVVVDDNNFYLSKQFKDIMDYSDNPWHRHWGGFKVTYFDTPWSFISAVAAFVLLVFTVAQTFYTVYQYYVPSGSK